MHLDLIHEINSNIDLENWSFSNILHIFTTEGKKLFDNFSLDKLIDRLNAKNKWVFYIMDVFWAFLGGVFDIIYPPASQASREVANMFIWSFFYPKQKTISKKVCNFGCQNYFCHVIFNVYVSKQSFLDKIDNVCLFKKWWNGFI